MIVLITGGARSGKSAYAVALAQSLGSQVVFLATAVPIDEEMAQRIRRHRETRPQDWITIEEPLEISKALRNGVPKNSVVVLDCMSVWLGNLFHHYALQDDPLEAKRSDIVRSAAHAEVETLCSLSEDFALYLIVVTNEVGLGLVPDSYLSRLYRDVLGEVNQVLAYKAQHVVLMVAGIPLAVKGPLPMQYPLSNPDH